MPVKPRAVLDTNVFVSGLINPKGYPGSILKALKAGKFIFVTSPEINEEVIEVIKRPRILRTYGLADHLFDINVILWEMGELVTKSPPIKVSKDPDDDKFLSAAVAGRADYLVTGDIQDLLSLKEYKNVKIVSPAEFNSFLH